MTQEDDGKADQAGIDQAGRALVRELLIDRLQEAGLQRPKGMTEPALAALIDRLCGWLRYMRAENLRTLAEEALLIARDGKWPAEAVLIGLAQGLQAKPLEQRRILHSWFTSAEGPVLLAQGALVEMYRFLARVGRAPLPGDRRAVAEEAGRNNRRATQIREWRARGVASDHDLGWLADYEHDLARLTALVEQGDQARRDKGAAA